MELLIEIMHALAKAVADWRRVVKVAESETKEVKKTIEQLFAAVLKELVEISRMRRRIAGMRVAALDSASFTSSPPARNMFLAFHEQLVSTQNVRIFCRLDKQKALVDAALLELHAKTAQSSARSLLEENALVQQDAAKRSAEWTAEKNALINKHGAAVQELNSNTKSLSINRSFVARTLVLRREKARKKAADRTEQCEAKQEVSVKAAASINRSFAHRMFLRREKTLLHAS